MKTLKKPRNAVKADFSFSADNLRLFTTYTWCLTLMGKLWGVYCEKIDRIITAPHCIYIYRCYSLKLTCLNCLCVYVNNPMWTWSSILNWTCTGSPRIFLGCSTCAIHVCTLHVNGNSTVARNGVTDSSKNRFWKYNVCRPFEWDDEFIIQHKQAFALRYQCEFVGAREIWMQF